MVNGTFRIVKRNATAVKHTFITEIYLQSPIHTIFNCFLLSMAIKGKFILVHTILPWIKLCITCLEWQLHYCSLNQISSNEFQMFLIRRYFSHAATCKRRLLEIWGWLCWHPCKKLVKQKSHFLSQQGQYRNLCEINSEDEAYEVGVKFTHNSQNPGDFWKGYSEVRQCHLAKKIFPLIKTWLLAHAPRTVYTLNGVTT